MFRGFRLSGMNVGRFVPENARAWWQQQSERDQMAVRILAFFMAMVFFFMVIWQPVMAQVERNKAKDARSEARHSQLYLRKYELLNQYGTADILPVTDWVAQEHKNYQLSIVRHKEGSLVIAYRNKAMAADFVQQFARFVALIDVRTDQGRREMILRYKDSA